MSSSKSKKEPPSNQEAPNTLFSTSTIKMLDLVGEGEIARFTKQTGAFGNDPLCSTYFNDVRVRNPDGSYNFNVSGLGFSFGYTLGTPNQQPIEGFEKIENLVPIGGNLKLSNPPSVGGGPYMDVKTTLNSATYPDADAIKVTVRVPALFTQDDRGNTNSYTVQYAIDIATDNGPFVNVGNQSIYGKCTSPYLKTSVHTLPKPGAKSEYSWTVRVRRTSQNVLSMKTQNDLYVDSIAVITSSSLNYPNTMLVGLRLSAEQFPDIPSRAYELDGTKISVPDGYIPTNYDDGIITPASYPGIWNGTFSSTKVWTNNPAWIFYDLITNKRYGLGKYVIPEWIDKWALYEISQYCDEMVDNGLGGLEPRFTINTTLQQRTDAFDLLNNIVSAFRGMMYFANGKIFAIQTSDKDSVYAFTNSNVVDGKFNYSDSARTTRSTVILVKWRDPANMYRETLERIEDQEGILRYGYIEKDVSAFGCTSKGQAYRIGSWILTTERIITETVTFQTSLEGLYLRPGDVFSVYDNYRFSKQQGGRIESFNAARTEITLDRPVTIENGFSYNLTAIVAKENLDDPTKVTDSSEIPLIRNPQIETRFVTTTPQTGVQKLTLSSAFTTGLQRGVTWLLSASGDAATVRDSSLYYRCLATSEPKDGVVEVLGLEYNTGINYNIEHAYSVEALPPNSGDQSEIDPPSNLVISGVTGLRYNNDFFSYLDITWDPSPSANVAYYRVSGQEPLGDWEIIGTPINSGLQYTLTKTGQHNFLVAAVSYAGLESDFISGDYDVATTNPLGGPPLLTGLTVYKDFNPFSSGASGIYTGYYGTTPGISWDTIYEDNGNPDPKVQFLDHYKVRLLATGTNAQLSQDVELDVTTTSFDIPTETIYNFSGGQQRTFKVILETHDIFGGMITGGEVTITNPAPRAPTYSGFFGANGGFNFTFNANERDQDVSGVYFWYDTDPLFTPTWENYTGISNELAGFVTHKITGDYYIWYSLVDTFSVSGSTIYGPIQTRTDLGVTGIKAGTGEGGFIEGGISLIGSGFIKVSSTGNNIYIYSSGIKSGQGFDLYYDGEGNWTISGKALEVTGNLSDVNDPNLARTNINYGYITLTDGGTINTDCSIGNVFEIVLGGDRLLANPTNMKAGATYIWNIDQDAAGSRNLTFDTLFKFPGGDPPVLTPDPNARDSLTCVYDGNVIRAVFINDFK